MKQEIVRTVWAALAVVWGVAMIASMIYPQRFTPILNAIEGVIFGVSGSIVWRLRTRGRR